MTGKHGYVIASRRNPKNSLFDCIKKVKKYNYWILFSACIDHKFTGNIDEFYAKLQQFERNLNVA